MTTDTTSASTPETPLVSLAVRSAVGGLLMGLANLVPGISGGTMLLASGIYPRFVQAIAEVTTLRFRLPSLVVLGSVVCSAGVAILLLAGIVKDLVVGYRWIMYSLFIGLTLGGIPVVWAMIRKHTRSVWIGATVGLLAMGALAVVQSSGLGTSASSQSSWILLVIAGLAGASAMILPGVSGGYLLLVLGQYIPILSGIDAFKEALQASDLGAAMGPAFGVGLPVGIGVVIGVVGVSNLLKFLLARYENATLGVLLGLLLGAVVGLWPFQHGVEPQVGDVVKGQVVTAEVLETLEPEDWPTVYFAPNAGHVAGALGLMVLGFGVVAGISRFGRERST